MGTKVTLSASDGFTLNAYTRRAGGQATGGVVVIQEVWGAQQLGAQRRRSLCPPRLSRRRAGDVRPRRLGYESENYGPDQFAKVIGETDEELRATKRRCSTSRRR